MASGDTLLIWTGWSGTPPAATYGTIDTRNSVPVIDFDAATDEAYNFSGVLPRNYAGGGVTITLTWMASSATSGNVMWTTAFERGNTDLDADSFATAVAGSAAAANGTSGIVTQTAIAHTNGAQMDSVAVGENFRLQVSRDANHASDTMTGDAELVSVEIRET